MAACFAGAKLAVSLHHQAEGRSAVDEPVLGFLLCEDRGLETSSPSVASAAGGGDRGYFGCYMVTNDRGYPLEFRATTPVHPNAIQRVIYGDKLEGFISQELVAGVLLKESEFKPGAVVVMSAALLGAQGSLPFPVVRLSPVAAGVVVGAQSAGAGLVETPHGELRYEVAGDRERDALQAIEGAAAQFDLMAVFDRMRAALDVLQREDERFR